MPTSKAHNTYPSVQRPQFRARVEAQLQELLQGYYRQSSDQQKMLEQDGFDLELYKRHNIETVLRICLRRAIDPLVAAHWATRNPKLCQEWGLFGAEESWHDRMFARDLHQSGVSDEEIYATRPTFATELLNGYFYFTLATEGPLATMVSAFYLESLARRTQPGWLDRVEAHIGVDKTRGARAHLLTDEEDEHIELTWNMIMNAIETEQDEERFLHHLIKINSLFMAYASEVYQSVHGSGADAAQAVADVPAAALLAAAGTAVV